MPVQNRYHYQHWNELHFGLSCVKRPEEWAFVSANIWIFHLSLPGIMDTKITLTQAVDMPDCMAMDIGRNKYAFLYQYLTYKLLFPQHYQRVRLRDSS